MIQITSNINHIHAAFLSDPMELKIKLLGKKLSIDVNIGSENDRLVNF